MPEADWNQRFEGTGNGGFAGKISYGALAEGLRRGFAVANTDMGMATPPGETAAIFTVARNAGSTGATARPMR